MGGHLRIFGDRIQYEGTVTRLAQLRSTAGCTSTSGTGRQMMLFSVHWVTVWIMDRHV